MQQTYSVQHNEHWTKRSFDEVVRVFEAALGSVEDGGLREIAASARNAAEFEELVSSREGSSGFMRFLTVDHGGWMSRYGSNARSHMYTIGNPLIARTGNHLPSKQTTNAKIGKHQNRGDDGARACGSFT